MIQLKNECGVRLRFILLCFSEGRFVGAPGGSEASSASIQPSHRLVADEHRASYRCIAILCPPSVHLFSWSNFHSSFWSLFAFFSFRFRVNLSMNLFLFFFLFRISTGPAVHALIPSGFCDVNCELHFRSIHHDISLSLYLSLLPFHNCQLRPFVPIVPVDSHQ